MSILTHPAQPMVAPEVDSFPLYRMSIEKYEQLVASGVFTKRDKFHLINGLLVAKMTKNPPHALASGLCRNALARIIPATWHAREEKPVRLPPGTEPEPDISVARGTDRDYGDHHPGPADVGLLVEVADSSLAEDRALWPIYRAAGISVYWIVNIPERQVEIYTGEGQPRIFRPGEMVPVVLDGIEVGRIAVTDLLP